MKRLVTSPPCKDETEKDIGTISSDVTILPTPDDDSGITDESHLTLGLRLYSTNM